MPVQLTSKTRSSRATALGHARQHSVRELNTLVGFAQTCAARAFPGNELKLRDDFQIGVDTPGDLAGALQRARAVAAACEDPANTPFLIGKGWYDKHAAGLREAIAALDS